MQTIGGLIFDGNAKCIAFNVMSDQRTEENDRPGGGSDNDKNRNRNSTNQ
jgi:hypothetical protein